MDVTARKQWVRRNLPSETRRGANVKNGPDYNGLRVVKLLAIFRSQSSRCILLILAC